MALQVPPTHEPTSLTGADEETELIISQDTGKLEKLAVMQSLRNRALASNMVPFEWISKVIMVYAFERYW